MCGSGVKNQNRYRSPPAFSVEEATEVDRADRWPDQRTTYSYLARPTPQPINAPAPAPYHDPTIVAPPAPIGKQPSLHEAAPHAAPTPAPTMRPNHTGCRSIQFLSSARRRLLSSRLQTPISRCDSDLFAQGLQGERSSSRVLLWNADHARQEQGRLGCTQRSAGQQTDKDRCNWLGHNVSIRDVGDVPIAVEN